MTIPRVLRPQLCHGAATAPPGDDWVHEVKYDGYRLLCRKVGERVQLLTRGGHDWTDRLASIADHARALPTQAAWLDGELVFLDDEGHTDFDALQAAIAAGDPSRLFYHVFDLPYADGADLTGEPLVARKERLAELTEGAPARIRHSHHLVGRGPDVFAQADALGYEGIVSKRAASPYRPGERTRAWQKVKSWRTYRVPLLGLGLDRQRRSIEALLVRSPEGAEYGGRVELGLHHLSGFRDELLAAATAPAPFPAQADDPRRVWLRDPVPILVRALPWRPGRKLRHATLLPD